MPGKTEITVAMLQGHTRRDLGAFRAVPSNVQGFKVVSKIEPESAISKEAP